MSDKLLTVAALRTTVEAELIRGKLEKAGIAAVLTEPEAQAEGTPAARVQVQVSQPDFERAMQLLFPIPQRSRAAKVEQPGWKCPKCGEQVMGQFPACWKCGTTRDGIPAPSGMPLPTATPSATAPSFSPAPTLPSASPAPSLRPGRPTLPLPPMPSVPQSAARVPEPQPAPRMSPAGGVSMPGGAGPASLEIPPIPPTTGMEPSKPAINGESPLRPAAVAVSQRRTPDEDGLKIVVPAWDGATKASRTTNKKPATDADDRAARRAWWAAVAGAACAGIAALGSIAGGGASGLALVGLICPLVLLYSIGVVMLLGLTGRELSRRGTLFFYGALAVNGLIIAAAFTWMGMHR